MRAGSQESKRHSRSLDLKKSDAKQVRHLHQRSVSENGLVESPIEKQVPSKMVSFYKKLSSSRSSRNTEAEIKAKKSRASIGTTLASILPKQNNTTVHEFKHQSMLITPTYLLAQTGESRHSLPNTLQKEINQFAIDGFAQKYFATHKKGLFRRTVPMNEMLRFTKDSIRQPLLNDQKTLYKREALKCFKILQIWMGDRPRPRQYDLMRHVQYLLDCGISKGPMRDEIYVQICRQLNGNPKSESVKRGWEMMCVVSITFPPSKNLESYLYDFIKKYRSDREVHVFSCYVLTRLDRICLKGARGKVLTVAEIERAVEAPFKPSVFGESLETIMSLEKDSSLKIPKIVIFLTDAVRTMDGKRTEGIFRVPGDADIVTDLRVRIEKGNYDSTGIDDPNVPASLLKYWLRDLSEPLIPTRLYEQCIQHAHKSDKVIELVNSLPDCNRRTIFYITHFLQEFTEPKVVQDTLMTVSNLAMVFAPNYLRCPYAQLPIIFENSKHEQAFVKTLVCSLKVDKDACVYGEMIATQ